MRPSICEGAFLTPVRRWRELPVESGVDSKGGFTAASLHDGPTYMSKSSKYFDFSDFSLDNPSPRRLIRVRRVIPCCSNEQVVFNKGIVVMNSRKTFLTAGIVLWAMLALVPLGCSRGGSSSSANFGIDIKGEGHHIAVAGQHVSEYMVQNKGKVPKDTGEMKDWAAKNNIPEDELLSTRDHEPYQVHEVARGPMKASIIVETTGVKGKKFMWSKSPGGRPAPEGSEATQEEIDSALKPSGAGRRGRPG